MQSTAFLLVIETFICIFRQRTQYEPQFMKQIRLNILLDTNGKGPTEKDFISHRQSLDLNVSCEGDKMSFDFTAPVNVSQFLATSHYTILMLWPDPIRNF